MSNIVTVYHITSDHKPVFSAGFSHSGFSHRLVSDVEAFEINRDLAQNFEYSTNDFMNMVRLKTTLLVATVKVVCP